MRTIDFTLLAVLIGSYIAMVGAIPVGDGSPAGSIARRDEEYVFYNSSYTGSMDVLTRLKKTLLCTSCRYNRSSGGWSCNGPI
ncbi:hypothetical protein BGY98DRAFT_1017919 [Russula aff. rugulosa BPL654]|nr:hypothetical protein BGY98DRAFT_1017919 [Russula aff. rugulosa BPL654]